MSIERAIQAHWSGDGALHALVPAERFFTAQAAGDAALPYVVLQPVSSAKSQNTSSGRAIETCPAEFVVFAASLESGMAVTGAMAARFNRRSFEVADVSVLNAQRGERQAELTLDGIWRIRERYQFTVLQQGVTVHG